MVLDIMKVLKAKYCRATHRRRTASGELAEPRCPRDDFPHLIRTNFVAAVPEKFTRDILNLGDA
jgi:hypothetical protein